MLMTVNIIRDYISTNPPPEITAFQALIYKISIRLMAGLIIMPLALLIFVPTWMLNDAGIVTHLRRTKLKYRRCPDTMGVGRWISDKMGGYAIVAYPLSVISTHGNDVIEALSNILVSPLDLISALLYIALLPGLVVAFIVPIVLLHEAKQNRSRAIVREFAKKLGAVEVRKEKLKEIKRGGSRTRVSDEAGAITEDKDVVTEEDLMISLKKSPKGKKRKKNKKKKT
jgi:hypothetical protein